jgi:hypothetical protein
MKKRWNDAALVSFGKAMDALDAFASCSGGMLALDGAK